MESLIRGMMAAVKEETSILNSLIDLGSEKRQLILKNRYKELDTLIQKEGIVHSRLARAEGARFKFQQELARKWEMPVEVVNSALLSSRARTDFPDLAAEMEQNLRSLGTAVNQLQNINQENRELTGYALEYIDYLWAMLEGDVAGIYSSDGVQAEERLPGSKLLDRKI